MGITATAPPAIPAPTATAPPPRLHPPTDTVSPSTVTTLLSWVYTRKGKGKRDTWCDVYLYIVYIYKHCRCDVYLFINVQFIISYTLHWLQYLFAKVKLYGWLKDDLK